MIQRIDNKIIGDSWDELEIDIPPSKANSASDVKLKQCPECYRLGKKHLNDTSISVIPMEGIGKCHKCGTSFIVRKESFREKKNTYTPPSKKNMTRLNEDGLEFFRNRKISQEAINRLKIVQERDSVAFVYFLDGAPVAVKYRGIKEKKFYQQKDGMHIVYNYDNVKEYMESSGDFKVAVVEGECFHPSAEILTPSGWVKLSEYNGQQVGQVHDDGSMTFTNPLAYVKKDIDDELVEYRSGSYYSLTTKEHNLVVERDGKRSKKKAIEIGSQIYIPRTAFYQGGPGLDMTDAEIRMMVAISADFTLRKNGDIYGTLKKERKILRLREIASLAGVKMSDNSTSREGYQSFFIRRGDRPRYATKLFPHSYIGQMSRRQINVFLEEILYWDGNSVPDRNQIEYSSKELSNVTFVQTLAHISGFTSTIMRRKNQYGSWYKLSILYGKQHSTIMGKRKNLVPYSGPVYCVTVPTGQILVRQDESISVSGNCDVAAFESAGIHFAVSLDSGAIGPKDVSIDGKLECINNASYIFDLAETIYIAVDNDENGRRTAEELTRRFPVEKVRIVSWGKYKDANEALMYDEKLEEFLKNAREIKMDGIFSASDVKDRLLDNYRNGLPKGTTTHMPSIDNVWKWRPGEVTIWTGYANEGKTTLLNFLIMLKAIFEGWSAAIFSPENFPVEEFYEDVIHSYIGKSTDIDFAGRATEAEFEKGIEFVDRHYHLIYPEERVTLDEIFKRVDYLVRKKGIRIVVLDPFNQIEHLYEKGETIDMYVSRFMTKLKRFAVTRKICMCLVAHQNKPEERTMEGNFPKPSGYKIKNGGTFMDKADNVVLNWRPYRATDDTNPEVMIISDKIKKKKLVAPTGECKIYFDWKTNRYKDPILNGMTPLDNPLAIPNETNEERKEEGLPQLW